MPERLTVMISSTARDLPEHRDQVRLGCQRAGFPSDQMMENLTALDSDAVDVSLAMVEEADIYLGVFAYRYGYVPDGADISITEMEYNRAVELNKPRLIFFIHEDHLVSGSDVEKGEGAAKLDALKDRIGKERVAAFFKSPEDLRGHVGEALSALRKQLEAGRPEDATETAAKLHRRTAIPAPPTPYIAHPYTLSQVRDLVGRRADLNRLIDWVTNPDSEAFGARIFCLVAIGGMGKSALTWKWFREIAPEEMTLAGRVWWSFYESDASFESFLNRALCYVSGRPEHEVRALPWADREALLLQRLDEQPLLIVLDGLERVLLAYHRMDASYLADDEIDERTANRVAGAAGLPAVAAQSFVGQHRLRQTIDPRLGRFLQRLAQVRASRVLITTRLYPSALQTPTGHPGPGCMAYFLRGLSDDDALELWRALGVSGSRSELTSIFRSVEGHPLLVQALASEVATYRRAPGNFAAWRADHPDFDPATLPLVQSRTHVLKFALEGMTDDVREVLRSVVAFRMPAPFDSLEALLVGSDKACNDVQGLDGALSELEDRGLIGWDREANRYDAHPIVRGVVWQQTSSRDRQAVYAAVEAHFEPMATPGWSDVESLEDLAPAIELYHALIGSGRYDDAFALFRDKLNRATLYRLAAHRERLAWLEPMFANGMNALPTLTSEHAQSHALTAVAQGYLFSGQPGRSLPLFRRSVELDRQLEDKDSEQVAVSNLGEALHEVGALREAAGALRQALTLGRAQDDTYGEGHTLVSLGRALSATDHGQLSGITLQRSLVVLAKWHIAQSEGVCRAVLAERALWHGDLGKARGLADHAWELAAHEKNEQDFLRAALFQGRAALGLGDSRTADERLHLTLTRARAANLVEFELPALIALADRAWKRGNPTEAKALLDEVWEAAERGPYPLFQADAHNLLAEIAWAEGDKDAAIAAATKAYRFAWCDGPPWAYHWGLEKAKAHLRAFGAPTPDMPPFDEAKFEPMPDVEINPKDEYWVDPNTLD